jgi:subtilase family serine protease
VVSSFTVPSTAGAGSPIAISDTTANLSATSAVASTTRFYLSANASLDGSDRLLSGAHAVPALVAGATSSASVSVDIPGDVAVGSYYVIAKADADSVVNETSESNNTSARLVYVGPDLVVSSLAGPATAAPGGTVVVTDTVKNQGGGAAAASSTRFYLSPNVFVDSSDVLLPEGRSVSDLPRGATNSGSTTLTIPSIVSTGSYYIVAKADAANGVVETQEGNNTAARSIQIGGDLVVSSLTVPPKAGAGSAILINDTTTNKGAGAIAESVTRFYLSTNFLLDAADPLLAGARAVPDLTGGAASSGSTTVTLPPVIATGTYYLIAKADADNAVIETQETNNTAARTIQIGGDLLVSSLTVPTRGAAGGTILVNDTTANRGAGALASSVTRFYLSTNAGLDAGDTPLAESRLVPDLASGADSSGSTTVTIPAASVPGVYYVIAKADADEAVAETQEGNNSTPRSITIGPDLTVSSISVISPAAAGSTVTVSDVVANQGAAGAGPSTTRFYLSTNYSLDASDLLLDGSRSVPAVAAGASNSGSSSLTIPPDTAPGMYVLIAKADADGGVPEGQESNNTRWREIRVTAAQ